MRAIDSFICSVNCLLMQTLPYRRISPSNHPLTPSTYPLIRQVMEILVARVCQFLQQHDAVLTVGSIRTVLEHLFFLFDTWAERKLQLLEEASSSSHAPAPREWPGCLDQVEGCALACLARPETAIRAISFRLMASVAAFVQRYQSVGQRVNERHWSFG